MQHTDNMSRLHFPPAGGPCSDLMCHVRRQCGMNADILFNVVSVHLIEINEEVVLIEPAVFSKQPDRRLLL